MRLARSTPLLPAHESLAQSLVFGSDEAKDWTVILACVRRLRPAVLEKS